MIVRNRRLNPLKADPTRTTTLRRKFLQEVTVRFDRLKGKINQLVVKEDAFGLKQKQRDPFKATTNNDREVGDVGSTSGGLADNSLVHSSGNHLSSVGSEKVSAVQVNTRFAFASDPKKVDQFMGWLQGQVDAGILQTTVPLDEKWTTGYIHSAYRQGMNNAYSAVKNPALAESLDFYNGTREEFLRSAFNAPVSAAKVELLAARTYEDLQGVTTAMSTQIRRELTDGLINGDSPREVARRLNNRVDKIGKTRARTMARTETIRAHAEGQLHAMEQLGVEEVGVMVEWSTAGDNLVCPLCEGMNGVVLKIKEAHGIIPRHASCRCSFVPANVGESTKGQVRGQKKVERARDESIRREIPKGSKRTLAEQKELTRWKGADTTIDKARSKPIVKESLINRAMKPAKGIWALSNAGPTLAEAMAIEAGASPAVAKLAFTAAFFGDFAVPGLPVGSAVISLGATIKNPLAAVRVARNLVRAAKGIKDPEAAKKAIEAAATAFSKKVAKGKKKGSEALRNNIARLRARRDSATIGSKQWSRIQEAINTEIAVFREVEAAEKALKKAAEKTAKQAARKRAGKKAAKKRSAATRRPRPSKRRVSRADLGEEISTLPSGSSGREDELIELVEFQREKVNKLTSQIPKQIARERLAALEEALREINPDFEDLLDLRAAVRAKKATKKVTKKVTKKAKTATKKVTKKATTAKKKVVKKKTVAKKFTPKAKTKTELKLEDDIKQLKADRRKTKIGTKDREKIDKALEKKQERLKEVVEKRKEADKKAREKLREAEKKKKAALKKKEAAKKKKKKAVTKKKTTAKKKVTKKKVTQAEGTEKEKKLFKEFDEDEKAFKKDKADIRKLMDAVRKEGGDTTDLLGDLDRVNEQIKEIQKQRRELKKKIRERATGKKKTAKKKTTKKKVAKKKPVVKKKKAVEQPKKEPVVERDPSLKPGQHRDFEGQIYEEYAPLDMVEHKELPVELLGTDEAVVWRSANDAVVENQRRVMLNAARKERAEYDFVAEKYWKNNDNLRSLTKQRREIIDRRKALSEGKLTAKKRKELEELRKEYKKVNEKWSSAFRRDGDLAREKRALSKKMNKASHEALATDNPTKFKVDSVKDWDRPGRVSKVPDNLDKEKSEAAHKFITEQVDKNSVNKLDLKVHTMAKEGNDRAFSIEGQGIWLSEKDGVSVYVHEIGHQLEGEVPGAKKAANRWRKGRITKSGKADVKLADEFPDVPFDAHEVGNDDDFLKAFTSGEERFVNIDTRMNSFYVGKGYVGGQTEIISMGLEQYYLDPVGFAKGDPEFFNLIRAVVTGQVKSW